MHVVATAGHVDHGKSTLVRALTGTDPDRLDEERRRGLSIELGYCWTDLGEVGEVAFVDVPGHERFLTTTLAGLGPVPVAMLVVAADDPWMPQAAEHLAALDALGVSHGLVAITRSDLADPAPALARAQTEVDRTSLAGVPAVVVSGRTGAGLDDLRATLAHVLASVGSPGPTDDVRLWVDRVFHVRGSGTVVTGTLPAGTVRVGDRLALGDDQVRVRSVESLGRPAEAVSGVARVALGLAPPVPGGLRRGAALVTPGAFEQVREVDVRVRGEGVLPDRPLLHLGAAQVAVQARPLGDRHARLRVDAPLPLRHGDRGILRDPGSRTLWGVEVVDAAPPPLGRRGAARARASDLAARRGGLADEVSARGVVRRDLMRRLGVTGDLPPGCLEAGDWLVSADRIGAWRTTLAAALADHPDGLTSGAVVRLLDLPDPALLDAVVIGPVVLRGGRLAVAGDLDDATAGALASVRAHLESDPFQAPDAERLAALGLDRVSLARLARDGHLLLLGEGVVLLPGADDEAVELLARLPQPFTTSAARQALGTSRRVVLPLLAHLDRTGRTVRLPDDTRRLR